MQDGLLQPELRHDEHFKVHRGHGHGHGRDGHRHRRRVGEQQEQLASEVSIRVEIKNFTNVLLIARKQQF